MLEFLPHDASHSRFQGRVRPFGSARKARRCRHPVRRRLRRRHAAHRHPVHQHLGRCSATTSRPFPISRPRSALPQARSPGVSGFQVRFADYDIHTPGDAPDVLVAMNPAALKVNLRDLKPNGDRDRQPRRVRRAQPEEGRLRRRTRSRTAVSPGTASSRSSSRRSPAGRSRTAGSTPSRRTAARTSSPWACATGCSAGRSRARSSGSRRSSQPSRSSPRRTSGR